ncbi:hypothetical protein CNECB9_5460009 [Cupriavidus necator]|uniref:Uncharacterized protein n=1 Tax=Cupriavidus necator TaxID=106590 RepID=A0A1K0JKP3_CUPNE|nr:hypothetical protein CNECB9_5460009 [Cupriavidus necator]
MTPVPRHRALHAQRRAQSRWDGAGSVGSTVSGTCPSLFASCVHMPPIIDDIVDQDLIPDRMYGARHAREDGQAIGLLSDKRLSWRKRDDTSVALVLWFSCSCPFRSASSWLAVFTPGCKPNPIFDSVPIVLRDAPR